MASPRKTVLFVLLLGLLGALGLVGCSSLSRDEVESALLALEKNAPTRAEGLRVRPLEIPTADGDPLELELTYLEARAESGEPSRQPVVLVHGTPSSLTSWTEVVFGAVDGEWDGLRAARDCYAIEVVGHGFAPGDAAPYGFQRCADFVNAAVEALELGPVHLVGHSYGGEFAWRAALDRPDLYASLTIADSSGLVRPDDGWLPEEVEMREHPLAKIGWILNSRERVTTALEPHFRGIPPERTEEFFLVCDRASNWRAMIDLVRDENGQREGELGTLAVPTLLLWGALDVAYPPDDYGRRFDEAIPDSRLVLVSDAGHYPHEEQPERFVAELVRFFGEIEALRSRSQ